MSNTFLKKLPKRLTASNLEISAYTIHDLISRFRESREISALKGKAEEIQNVHGL